MGSRLASCPRGLLAAALVLGGDKPDGPLGRIGRRHEFAQGIEYMLELGPRVADEGVVAHGQGLGLVFQEKWKVLANDTRTVRV